MVSSGVNTQQLRVRFMHLLQRTQYNYGHDHLNKHDAQAPLAVQYWVPHWITLIARKMSPTRDPQFSCCMWLRCYLQLYRRDPSAPTLVSYAMNAAVASVSSQAKGSMCRSGVHIYRKAVSVLHNKPKKATKHWNAVSPTQLWDSLSSLTLLKISITNIS